MAFGGNFACGIQRVLQSGQDAPSCPLGSQSQRAIGVILPAGGASHIIKDLLLALINRAGGLYVPENLDRCRKYRPNAVRSLHSTEVKILPYRPT